MRKDFANRSARHNSSTRSTKKTKGGGARKKAQSPVRRLFHGPSFSGGMIFGALLVLGGAYLPELLPWVLDRNNQPVTATTQTAAKPPAVTFEFQDMLRDANVAADGSEYVDPDAQAAALADPDEYLLQAASFRSEGEAEALRANLLLLSLPATTDVVTLQSGRWYRVTVGPFATKVLAQRAVTQLRQRNLAPLWIKRKASPPATLAAGSASNPR